MKKVITSLALLLVFASTAVAVIEDFDVAHDYVTDGVGGTIWSGIMNAGNMSVGNTNDNPGYLTIDGTGNWNGNETTGPFLYKEVTGDFIAEAHQLVGVNSAGGLMVRLGGNLALGGAGEDNMWLATWSSWNVGSIFWPTNNGSRPERDITWDGDATGGPTWTRVERQGANFYWSRSYDGVTWSTLSYGNPMVRNDMNVPTLQVGLIHSFGGVPIQYDYFKLTETPVALSGSASVNEEGATSATITVNLTGPAQTAPVDVVITDTGDPNDLLLNGLDKPLTLSFALGETQKTFTVQAKDDELQEGPETVKLEAKVSSADPGYASLPDTTWIYISVTDNDQGTLVVDEGDGLLVGENQGVSDSFSVALSLPLVGTGTVTVNMSTVGQVAVSPNPLTFTDANWNVPQSVTVTGVDDAVLENDPHNGTISFSIASTNPAYAGSIVVPGITATVQENDCGAWGYSRMDYNQDCVVNMSDLAQLVLQWMQCTSPYADGCVDAR